MEEKYGKLQMRCKVQILACVGVFAIGLILLAAAVILLINGISKGFSSGTLSAFVITLVLGAALFAHTLLLLVKCGIEIYETAIVVVELKIPYRIHRRVYEAKDIFALLWEGPGENASNSRSYRKNTNTCEIITDGGRTSYRLSDGYYEESFSKGIADFQTRNNIPHDLEKRKKHKY